MTEVWDVGVWHACLSAACSLRNGLIIDALADFSPVCRSIPIILTEMGGQRPTTQRAVLDTPTVIVASSGRADLFIMDVGRCGVTAHHPTRNSASDRHAAVPETISRAGTEATSSAPPHK